MDSEKETALGPMEIHWTPHLAAFRAGPRPCFCSPCAVAFCFRACFRASNFSFSHAARRSSKPGLRGSSRCSFVTIAEPRTMVSETVAKIWSNHGLRNSAIVQFTRAPVWAAAAYY